MIHAFVDESHRDRLYVVTAVIVPTSTLASTRTGMRKMLQPGQERIHFQTESDRKRKKIISGISRLSPTAWIFTAKGDQEPARATCLVALVDELAQRQTERLVLETRGRVRDQGDRRILYDALKKTSATISYEHFEARHEPLLWLPDIIGWAHGAGGHWKDRVRSMITQTVTLP
jgi:hypothetical protein